MNVPVGIYQLQSDERGSWSGLVDEFLPGSKKFELIISSQCMFPLFSLLLCPQILPTVIDCSKYRE
jgi:hypothetical protein